MFRGWDKRKTFAKVPKAGALPRLIALTLDETRAIREPNPAASALIYAAMGGGKTTGPAMTTIQSLLADHGQALLYNDIKGEISHQIAEMCVKRGRNLGVIDPFTELGTNYPYRIDINPFDSITAAIESYASHLPFVLEVINHALIEEPSNDKRNFYWRESGREFLEHGENTLVSRNKRLATPGGLHTFMSDPDCWEPALEIEANDPESELRPAAKRILDLRDHNPEHYSQHLATALNALKIFSYGPLREAGLKCDLTYQEIIRDKWVIGFVSPVRYAERIGPYIAQHVLSLMQAQLTGRYGRTCLILDEFCAAPLREAVSKITVFRAFGLKCIYITQSRQDAINKYGEKEIAVLEDNCAVKQILKVSNIEEAERLSKAIGDQLVVQQSVGLNSDRDSYAPNVSLTKERIFSPEELMRLPDDDQLVHFSGLGWLHCKKIRQNQIAPYCFDLAPNPLEGGILPPDPKVELDPTPRNVPPASDDEEEDV